jgi:hypothetical protein
VENLLYWITEGYSETSIDLWFEAWVLIFDWLRKFLVKMAGIFKRWRHFLWKTTEVSLYPSKHVSVSISIFNFKFQASTLRKNPAFPTHVFISLFSIPFHNFRKESFQSVISLAISLPFFSFAI